ncbi:hypothetical protein M0812_09313 [Anaeramoeba flamelloides]|uniref:MULE transposase domain-containing protein n=1 Tax=Anaeramoeba flamelloides TaxID=1746091 RepID=A0AAV7ZNB2_9EUKA|nr:hypothetical protein M0812_09313 [Anaeramoeba flamelloides]
MTAIVKYQKKNKLNLLFEAISNVENDQKKENVKEKNNNKEFRLLKKETEYPTNFIYKKRFFHKKNEKENIFYYCFQCKANIVIDRKSGFIVKEGKHKKHCRECPEISWTGLSYDVENFIRSEIDKNIYRPEEVLQNVYSHYHHLDSLSPIKILSDKELKSKIITLRRLAIPPKQIDQFYQGNEKTIEKTKFLRILTHEPEFCCIWISNYQLNVLKMTKQVFLDGTFKFPDLKPTIITTDFEIGLINSIQEKFPYTKLICCYFHFCQALHRKRKSLKFSKEEVLKSLCLEYDLRMFAKMDPQSILEGLQTLLKIHKNSVKLTKFIKYFIKFYVINVGITKWNHFVFGKFIKFTNCFLEWYNSRLNGLIQNKRNTLHELCVILKKEEFFWSNSIIRSRKGAEKNQKEKEFLIDKKLIFPQIKEKYQNTVTLKELKRTYEMSLSQEGRIKKHLQITNKPKKIKTNQTTKNKKPISLTKFFRKIKLKNLFPKNKETKKSIFMTRILR